MLPYVFRMPILTHISTHQIYLVNKIYMLFLIKVSVPFLSIPCRNYLFFYSLRPSSFLFSRRICHSFWFYLSLWVSAILLLLCCIVYYLPYILLKLWASWRQGPCWIFTHIIQACSNLGISGLTTYFILYI